VCDGILWLSNGIWYDGNVSRCVMVVLSNDGDSAGDGGGYR
jgi:hypothetical protein